MKIISSAKEFIKDHKPEVIAFAASAGAIAAFLYVAHNRKNCIDITRDVAEELAEGGCVHFMARGTEYVVAQLQVDGPTYFN